MKNSNKDVINFIKNRRISNVIRLYVDRNFGERISYIYWVIKRLKTILKLLIMLKILYIIDKAQAIEMFIKNYY